MSRTTSYQQYVLYLFMCVYNSHLQSFLFSFSIHILPNGPKQNTRFFFNYPTEVVAPLSSSSSRTVLCFSPGCLIKLFSIDGYRSFLPNWVTFQKYLRQFCFLFNLSSSLLPTRLRDISVGQYAIQTYYTFLSTTFLPPIHSL